MTHAAAQKRHTQTIGQIVIGLVFLAILISSVSAIALFYMFPKDQRNEFLSSIKPGTPERHIIPANYSGWLFVHHNVESAPALPFNNGALLVQYPEAGVVKTSTRWKPGLKRNEYVFKTSTGIGPELSCSGANCQIWGVREVTFRDTKEGPVTEKRSCFFVGTYQEYLDSEPIVSHPGMARDPGIPPTPNLPKND